MTLHRIQIHLAALIALTLTACGVNPVTGKREIQFVSEAQELQIGEQQYAPTRQSEGGDFKQLPELTSYVNEIGQKLAAVSDRKLPYEFVVLNSSVPNAWALPGGKIAVNRGLLPELRSEAELAAVLGHEIVHAAARHGAKAQERGTLLQAGIAVATIGAAVGGADQNVAGLVIQGAGVGAQLVETKYGREQELEADEYGMKYMKRAGYDPWAGVTLQEAFVRLSKEPLAEKDEKKAIGYYEKSIQLDPDYFGAYLGAGVAQYRSGNKARAEELFTQSSKLLPTAPAAYYLGELAKGRGETQKAMQYYQAAASAQGEVAQAAAGELVRLDLPQNPGNYVAAGGQLDASGRVILVVQNRAPIALSDIRVTPVLVNSAGQIVSTASTLRIGQALPPNERVAVDAGLGQLSQDQMQGLRFRVEGARAVE